MEKIRISSGDILLDKVAALYESAFPLNERREIGEFFRLLEENSHFHVDVFLDGNGNFAGFLSSWEWDDFRYGEHFAIEEGMRGGGIGSQVLRNFLASGSQPLILEVEPPVDEMAVRRIGFYERNGLRLWNDLHYIQPAYSADREPIELKLMTFGDINLTDGDERIKRIHRYVYGVE